MDKQYFYKSHMTDRKGDDIIKNYDNRKYNDRKYTDRKYSDRLYDSSGNDESNFKNWIYSEKKQDEEIKYIQATPQKLVRNDTDEEIKNSKKDDDNKYDWIKFRPILVKEVLHSVLMEQLQGKEYNGEECTEWTKTISDEIKTKLKDMGYDRYKFIVQVVIGEQRGEGVKMGCRCFWDSDTDNYAQDIFMNDSLFCVAAAFGVFFY